MKKTYEKPILAADLFDVEDIITVSGGGLTNMLHQVAGLPQQMENMLDDVFSNLKNFGSGS